MRHSPAHLNYSVNGNLDSYAYLYNPANQRTNLTRVDSSTVAYRYDNIGQLVVADSSVTGEDTGYSYDHAWNVSSVTNSGATNAFMVNGLNELTNWTAGIATYDVNGNMSSKVTTVSTEYAFDDENRPVGITNVITGATNTTYLVYDGLGRLRIRYEITGGFSEFGGDPVYVVTAFYYIYDGFRVIQERNPMGPTVAYTRGSDLSGSLEGAGGIGGLLARSSYSSGNPNVHNYYFADGNGNITYMLDNSQSMVASYRYDPFGNTVSKSGSLADANVYRFSSKELHVNTGMYYYGYRFYDPSLQRWMNRDPMEESGGLNLYEFVNNNPLTKSDPLGLDVFLDTHPVAFGENHSFVLLEVNCKSSWFSIAPFTLRSLPNGDHYATLGAGPSFGAGGHLINGVDREKDADLSTVNYSRQIVDPPGMSDDDFITLLINTHRRYNEKARYTLFPQSDDDYYNSNSYVSGLLGIALGFAEGHTPQQPPNTPGFEKPVPHRYFR